MWDSSISSEIAAVFDELTWRHDDHQRALEEWSFWRRARQREQELERERSPDYITRRRGYMAKYRNTPERRAAAVERTRRWREANREKARAHARKHEKRRSERAKADPVFGEKWRAIRRNSAKRTKARRLESGGYLDAAAKSQGRAA